MKYLRVLLLLALCAVPLLFLGPLRPVSGQAPDPKIRENATQAMGKGNWKDAYADLSRLALDPQNDPGKVGQDLQNAIQCLRQLGRVDEIDDLREKAIALHAKNWRLLFAAAQSLQNDQHNGFMIAGKFARGGHRGGGKWVNCYERDRVRALQLMEQALAHIEPTDNRVEVSNFYATFAGMMMGNRGWSESWRLQYLTDIASLPDYDEGYYYGYGSGRGAPVDENGDPIFFGVPDGWKTAQNDGERWRYLIAMSVLAQPEREAEMQMQFAGFLHAQFGVETLARYSWFARSFEADGGKPGRYAVQTLTDAETMARLATGPKRFALPDEHNPILIYQQVAQGNSSYRKQAIATLAQIFENRRQYDRAVACWRLLIDDKNYNAQHRINQILGNWGMFEPVVTQPAGQGATIEFRFRNANSVNLTAKAIDIKALLNDVRTHIKSNPNRLEWNQIEIGNLGYRLVQEKQTKYIGEQVAEWDAPLTPRPNHFDRRVTLRTPLKTAGAYELTARMPNGNISKIIIWVADLAIVKKPLNNAVFYYVADAVTGKPIANAALDFFGYRQRWVNTTNGQGKHEITTAGFQKSTDADGQLILAGTDQPNDFQWLITATAGNRFTYHGFTGAWYQPLQNPVFENAKAFVITDRPVYRPEQTVKFKFWVNQAKYDLDGKCPYAGMQFTVRVNNPMGEKAQEKTYTADAYGGFDGEFKPDGAAKLGVYSIQLINGKVYGGGSFRLEEYKKPEFEVKVQAPTEPVALGETITARIEAKYLFGAPVTNAKVKYKVLRSGHTADWYPVDRWDWLYRPGYWWYGYDYAWYPGWRDWGCVRPMPIWWGYRGQPQPELIAEAEVPVGADGTVPVTIDTALAKELLGDTDHRYEITAEVTDSSRRTIVGTGSVLVSRKPFKIYAWLDSGHYRVGDAIQANFNAHTLNGNPVKGRGIVRLLKVAYKTDPMGNDVPVETEVQRWPLDTRDDGTARLQMKAAAAGQYRVSYKITDEQKHEVEGGYVFYVRGEGDDGSKFRFSDLELVTDKREYQPGETVNLLVNTNKDDATVLLFVRPVNGVCNAPKVLRLNGKSALEKLLVGKGDMPNFFVEALTVADGKVYSEMREVMVPPEQRALNVQVQPASSLLQPGKDNNLKVKVTGADGKPYTGSLVVSVYDKAVEYISGGSNIPEIKAFFWKWQRHHNPSVEHSLNRGGYNIVMFEQHMAMLGVFGHATADDELSEHEEMDSIRVVTDGNVRMLGRAMNDTLAASDSAMAPAPMMSAAKSAGFAGDKADRAAEGGGGGGSAPMAAATVRTNFADTALWVAAITTDANGAATIPVKMPDSLTTWKARVWAMGDGSRVGEGTAEIITKKNIMVRLEAPRFFITKDEVVVSAIVHNYLATTKSVQVSLKVENDVLESVNATAEPLTRTVKVAPNTDVRVDWRVRVVRSDFAHVTVQALTDQESDAMKMVFPAYIHGMLKTDSYSGAIRPDGNESSVTLKVPADRLPKHSRLEVRYSPSLAGAMVDALPYLVSYPYENTEAVLNRFLPTVITQKVLLNMGLNLKDIQAKRTNLNAQEIGDDKQRAQDWKRIYEPWEGERNPVFDDAEVAKMAAHNLGRLQSMQVSDGGWGWFSGYGEQSWPHTTALVVHGLQIARANGSNVPPEMIARGIQWLKGYQTQQIEWLKRGDQVRANGDLAREMRYYKMAADALDAFVYMVLVDEKADNLEMRNYLWRDKVGLPVYAKSMFAMALHDLNDIEKRDAVIHNIEQFLVQDNENQTAYLKLPEGNWWYWYGSEYEAQAYYLKLLARTAPKSDTASRLAKYLINNRKHATYWNSTRDTAIVIEALADYMKASGEDQPNMTVDVKLDGRTMKTVRIDGGNLFSFDNKLVLEGPAITTGEHTLTLVKRGTGALYFNAYLTNFTTEDMITKAGLEVKVNRKFYKLVRVEKTTKVAGTRGQPLDQRVEKYTRFELANLATLKSGDLVEVELEIDSKNDYEYLMFSDMKASGFEPVEVRSGYGNNEMGAYMEMRDNRVCFFVRQLARGKHSLSYRLRAEIPGKFSAMPATAAGIYAPELKGNSDEIKLNIMD